MRCKEKGREVEAVMVQTEGVIIEEGRGSFLFVPGDYLVFEDGRMVEVLGDEEFRAKYSEVFRPRMIDVGELIVHKGGTWMYPNSSYPID